MALRGTGAPAKAQGLLVLTSCAAQHWHAWQAAFVVCAGFQCCVVVVAASWGVCSAFGPHREQELVGDWVVEHRYVSLISVSRF
jgi:hypothetical protein